ncbi:MAG: pyridoxal 5'-phosphate synthase glutaminase subunit PdxT [Actinomycetota bacterium]
MVGVLALQGAFARHADMLRECGVDTVEIRQPRHLDGIHALVMPGGESTTMVKLLHTFELAEPIGELLAGGLPTFGTCAGMILLARSVTDGHPGQFCFDAIDIAVRRNGYGRQINSFEADLVIEAAGAVDDPLRAVFIRAPVVEKAGHDVEVLAAIDDVPVLCRQGPVLVSSFHPELTDDSRLHQLFVSTLD